jgi:hypothetical protein
VNVADDVAVRTGVNGVADTVSPAKPSKVRSSGTPLTVMELPTVRVIVAESDDTARAAPGAARATPRARATRAERIRVFTEMLLSRARGGVLRDEREDDLDGGARRDHEGHGERREERGLHR